MEVGKARTIGIGILLAFGLMGCGKVSKDNTRVLASVGGEKITEQAFAETVRLYLGDEAKAKDILTNAALREQRNQILGTLVNQKALMQWVKAEGLDRDPKVQIEITSALAGAYFQILADRLVTKAEPTDAELEAFYDDYALQAKAAGQGAQVPSYDQVKAQLPAAWKRRQAQIARESLLAQLNQRYPVVFDPDYRPNQMP
ncbi:MAG: SurA N-terminal domain-containing protein [Holophaga sp.]|jgi:hypothetical protein